MDLKDLLYKNRYDIGLKDDVTYSELLKLISLIKDNEKDDNLKNMNEKDIKNLVSISIEMTELLKECRTNMLPIKTSKKIDNLLKKIKSI